MGLISIRTCAAEPDFSILSSDGSDCSGILDGNSRTTEPFFEGTTLQISASEPVTGLYIKWDYPPGEWILNYGEEQVLCGSDNFLHEYIPLSGTSDTLSFTIAEGAVIIADLFVFSDGEIPEYVQVWTPAWDDPVDVLYYAVEEGDEVRYFRDLIPEDARIQAAYFTDHYPTDPGRNHEILDALWRMGFTHYPKLGSYYDYEAETPEELRALYETDDPESGVVETLRRFQPQVVVTPGFGEDADWNSLYASELIQTSVSSQKLFLAEGEGQTAEELMKGVYTYDQQAERDARLKAREEAVSAELDIKPETNKLAGNSLKILVFFIIAITVFLLVAELIVSRRSRRNR